MKAYFQYELTKQYEGKCIILCCRKQPTPSNSHPRGYLESTGPK